MSESNQSLYDEFKRAYRAVEQSGASVGRVLVCRRKIRDFYREQGAIWPHIGDKILLGELVEGEAVARMWTAEVIADDRHSVPLCFPAVPEGCVATVQEERT